MLSLLIEGRFAQLQLFSRTISSWLFCNRKLLWIECNYAMIDNYPECIHLILWWNLFPNCPKFILFLLLQMIQRTSELFLWCFWDFCYCWEESEDASFASFYGTYFHHNAASLASPNFGSEKNPIKIILPDDFLLF